MTGYSQDLREHIIHSWQNGGMPAGIGTEYNVGWSTVKRYITRYNTASTNGPIQGEQLAILAEQAREHDDATVDRHTDL